MHAADGATKRRETADFDPARLWAAEIERANLRVEKLISICFMAEVTPPQPLRPPEATQDRLFYRSSRESSRNVG
jgi:hypothetical protein